MLNKILAKIKNKETHWSKNLKIIDYIKVNEGIKIEIKSSPPFQNAK
jgi:hypothetical protein